MRAAAILCGKDSPRGRFNVCNQIHVKFSSTKCTYFLQFHLLICLSAGFYPAVTVFICATRVLIVLMLEG